MILFRGDIHVSGQLNRHNSKHILSTNYNTQFMCTAVSGKEPLCSGRKRKKILIKLTLTGGLYPQWLIVPLLPLYQPHTFYDPLQSPVPGRAMYKKKKIQNFFPSVWALFLIIEVENLCIHISNIYDMLAYYIYL